MEVVVFVKVSLQILIITLVSHLCSSKKTKVFFNEKNPLHAFIDFDVTPLPQIICTDLQRHGS